MSAIEASRLFLFEDVIPACCLDMVHSFQLKFVFSWCGSPRPYYMNIAKKMELIVFYSSVVSVCNMFQYQMYVAAVVEISIVCLR
jgi:hypothetical protein